MPKKIPIQYPYVIVHTLGNYYSENDDARAFTHLMIDLQNQVRLGEEDSKKLLKGFVIRLKNTHLSINQAHELAALFNIVRAKGFQVWLTDVKRSAHIHNLAGLDLYNSADRVFCDGDLKIFGSFGVTQLYYRSLLDLIGIIPTSFCQKHKSYSDTMVKKSMSPESRQQIEDLLKGRYDYYLNKISQRNPIAQDSKQAWDSLFRYNQFVPAEFLLKHKVITSIETATISNNLLIEKMLKDNLIICENCTETLNKHESPHNKRDPKKQKCSLKNHKKSLSKASRDLYEATHPQESGQIALLLSSIRKSIFRVKSIESEKPNGIAIIHINKVINNKDLHETIRKTNGNASALLEEIKYCLNAKHVKGVVIRVNSGGGSVDASVMLYEAIKELAAKKKVVVSIQDVMASGALYCTLPAHRIIANPLSVVGSIGVTMTHFALDDNRQKEWVNIETVALDPTSTCSNQVLSQKKRQFLTDYIDHFYDHFITLVAVHRPIDKKTLHPLAQGLVYLAQDPRASFIIDHISTSSSLLESVAWLKHICDLDEKSQIYFYRKKMTLEEFLLNIMHSTMKTMVRELGHSAKAQINEELTESQNLRMELSLEN